MLFTTAKTLSVLLCGLALLTQACLDSSPGDISIIFMVDASVEDTGAAKNTIANANCAALANADSCWPNCVEEVDGSTQVRVEIAISEDTTASYAAVINDRNFPYTVGNSARMSMSLVEWIDNLLLCDADEHVQNGACEACAAGSTNDAGDHTENGNTDCDVTYCLENEHVSDSNTCESCATGLLRNAGDPATGAATACTDPCADMVCDQLPGECYEGSCAAGTCSYAPLAADTVCSVGTCDGAGVCVEPSDPVVVDSDADISGSLASGETVVYEFSLQDDTSFDVNAPDDADIEVVEGNFGSTVYTTEQDDLYLLSANSMEMDDCSPVYKSVSEEENTWSIGVPESSTAEDGTVTYRYRVDAANDRLMDAVLGLSASATCYENAVLTVESSGASESAVADNAPSCMSGLRANVGCVDCHDYLVLTVQPVAGQEVLTGRISAALEGMSDVATMETWGPRCLEHPTSRRRLLAIFSFILTEGLFQMSLSSELGGAFDITYVEGSSANGGGSEANNGLGMVEAPLDAGETTGVVVGAITAGIFMAGAVWYVQNKKKKLHRRKIILDLETAEGMVDNGQMPPDNAIQVAAIVSAANAANAANGSPERSLSAGNQWMNAEVDETEALVPMPDGIVSFRS